MRGAHPGPSATMEPPAISDGLVERRRLLDQLTTDARVTLVTALPGYGKTVVVRQWIDAVSTPSAWLSLELLDGDPAVFWSHFLAAVGAVRPGVEVEPTMLLAERGPEDPLFLAALAARLEGTDRAVLVLDGPTELLDPQTLDGLVYLVERVGDRLGLVVTAREAPRFPLARWRSAGWIREIREDDLRFTDIEAVAVARAVDPDADITEVAALNRRLDGWPIGLHMALVAARDRGRGGTAAAYDLATDDGSLADYLVAGVLSGMHERERDIALTLSVLQWFDPAMCRDVAGRDAEAVVRRLLARGTFLTVVEPLTGVMRFHALFRELMELHLSLTDPIRRVDLHRRAARLWQERGDLTSAYHHLATIGEAASADPMLLEPTLAMVDDGDVAALRDHARHLPSAGEIVSPNLALDLAVVAFYAHGARAAKRWCDHAEKLIEAATATGAHDHDTRLRLHARRCAIALVEADLDTALVHIEHYRELNRDARAVHAFDRRFPVIAARVMLGARREDDAAYWIRRAERITGSTLTTQVTVPTLRAWQEWLFGDLRQAAELAERAVAWMEVHVAGANHLTFDTLITTSWCRLSIGDLDGAERLSRAATEDAEVLGDDWQHLQAGYLAAQLAVLTHNPLDALRIIDDLRARVRFERCRPYADRILGIEIEARAASGTLDDPDAAIACLEPGARSQLLRAQFASSSDDDRADLLANRTRWPAQQHLQAELLLLAARDDPSSRADLTVLLAQCAHTGWVSPFLGLGAEIEQLLASLPLHELHPRLARCLELVHATDRAPREPTTDVSLTARERSLLALLQTHLSYADMGEQLCLSVNTVKSNLQRIYRKLGARTRREAVASARDAGLLEEGRAT